MHKKKTTKKKIQAKSKKKGPARKKVKKIPLDRVARDVLLESTEEELRSSLGDVRFEELAERGKSAVRKALEEVDAASEAKTREKIMEVEKKIFEVAFSQAVQLLNDELAIALEAMRTRAKKGGR